MIIQETFIPAGTVTRDKSVPGGVYNLQNYCKFINVTFEDDVYFLVEGEIKHCDFINVIFKKKVNIGNLKFGKWEDVEFRGRATFYTPSSAKGWDIKNWLFHSLPKLKFNMKSSRNMEVQYEIIQETWNKILRENVGFPANDQSIVLIKEAFEDLNNGLADVLVDKIAEYAGRTIDASLLFEK